MNNKLFQNPRKAWIIIDSYFKSLSQGQIAGQYLLQCCLGSFHVFILNLDAGI